MTKEKLNNNDIVDKLILIYDDLKSKREELERIWEQVALFVRPQKIAKPSLGKEVFDSTAVLCAENLVSGLWSLASGSSSSWFSLSYKNHNKIEVNQAKEISSWLLNVNKILLDNLADSKSGFYYKSYEFYADLVCFGSAIFYLKENSIDDEVLYEPLSLHDTYIGRLYHNSDLVIRRLYMDSKEAINLFGKDGVSNEIISAYNENSNEKFCFLHYVLPNKYFNDEAIALRGMKFVSYYIEQQTKHLVSKSGYYEFPFMISKWSSTCNALYGQSPAMNALSDIKMLNAMSKTMLIATQKLVDPPLLAPSEGSISGLKTLPGSIIYGGIDPVSGNQLIKPMQLGADLASGYALAEQRRNSIKEAFYNSVLLFAYSTNATATEVLSTNEQKFRILGSKIARIQSEFLYPLIKRQLNILDRLDKLPNKPIGINIADIDIEFNNSWNKQQRMMENLPINNMYDSLNNFAKIQPAILQSINWQQLLRVMAQNNSIPNNIFNSENE